MRRRAKVLQDEKTLKMSVLLADFSDRNAEIKQRTDHEQRSYLSYFTSLVTVLLAIAAANRFGTLLTKDLQNYLPVLVLGLAIFLLWLALDAINEQLRIRIIAVYIHHELRPAIVGLLREDPGGSGVLGWERFQSCETFRVGVASPFVSAMLGFRGVVGYAPSLVVFLYYRLGSVYFQAPGMVWVEITLIVLWAVIAAVPLVLTILLGTQARYRAGA